MDNLTYRNTFEINPWFKRKDRVKPKKWNRCELLNIIRAKILELDVIEVNRESFSDFFRADIGMVDWCFMKLNKEGLLRRNDIKTPDCHGWRPKWYLLNKQGGSIND